MRVSSRQRPLAVDDVGAAVRAILTALSLCRPGSGRGASTSAVEELVLQVVTGPHLSALVVPSDARQPVPLRQLLVRYGHSGASGLDARGRMDNESRTALVRKVTSPGVCAVVRIGVVAATPQRRRSLLLGLLGVLCQLEARGVQIGLASEKPRRVDDGTKPWRWPLRLNLNELAALTALPVGEDKSDESLPGLPALHPKPLAPTFTVQKASKNRSVIGTWTAPGESGRLTRSTSASLRHTHVLGPTSTGESWLLANLAMQDMEAGRGLVVIEPKGTLIDDLLERVPSHRRDEVVVLDPVDVAPVGLNPLASSGTPETKADEIVSIFHQLFADSWGPRTAGILTAATTTLTRKPDAPIVQLPLMLTSPQFRAPLEAAVSSDIGLASFFWATYESWSEGERANAVAPVLNKLRAVMLRPSLRAVLGQTNPRFDVRPGRRPVPRRTAVAQAPRARCGWHPYLVGAHAATSGQRPGRGEKR